MLGRNDNTTPTRYYVRTATNKNRGCKPTACNTKDGFMFLPSDANLTACSFEGTIFYSLFIFCC
ncbi:MAG: hypothetical protein LBT56_06810 [Prevotellaceae bacterium]|nr:hypothetical protein [Prevotellaceae bacterium]